MSEQDVDGKSAVPENEGDSDEGESEQRHPEGEQSGETTTEAVTEQKEAVEQPADNGSETAEHADQPTDASGGEDSNPEEKGQPDDESASQADEATEQKPSGEKSSPDATENAQTSAADEQAVADLSSEQTDEEAESGDPLEEIAEEPASDAADALKAVLEGEEQHGEDIPRDKVVLAGEPDAQLVETIEETSAETLAQAINTLQLQQTQAAKELTDAYDEIDDLESRLARKQADFQNYKQRQKREQQRIKEQATEDFVTRILDVRDNLARALEQDEDVDIRGGVESTLNQFDQQLERENVTRIEPEPGGDIDPRRHEVLATIASAEPEDTIATVHRPGYEMGEKVLRPAQVAVSDGSQYDPESDDQE